MTKQEMDPARSKILDEMTMARSLGANCLKERQKAMEKLRLWMSNEEEDFTEEDYMRLWKGLFYCMWMSDKPLVQEELAEEISSLIHAPPSFDSSLLFIRCFYLTMMVEWTGIDHHRIDKFMMLVRRFLRQSFELCRKKKWRKEEVDKFSEEFFYILKFLKKGPLGLITHVKDIYVEELAKVSRGNMPAEQVAKFIEPFARFVATVDVAVLYKLTQKIFSHIIKQSEHGIEHTLKVHAWKKMGFPANKFKKIKRVSREDEEDDNESDDSDADLLNGKSDSEIDEGENEMSQFQDLRAGGDVIIPTLDFDPRTMIEMLNRVRDDAASTKKGKGRIQAMTQLFQKLVKGQYPLITNQIRAVDARRPINNIETEVEAATKRLQKIHDLTDAESLKTFYAMKQKPVPSDDILLAGSGKRKRDWVEKHEYNDSIYNFGQKNEVKNQSGVWTVTAKANENGVATEDEPGVISDQKVINAHDALETSLKKKRKVEKGKESDDLEDFPIDQKDPIEKKKQKLKNLKQLNSANSNSESNEEVLSIKSTKKNSKSGITTPLKVKSKSPIKSSSGNSPSKLTPAKSPKSSKKTPIKKAVKSPETLKLDVKTPLKQELLRNETPKSVRKVEFVLTNNRSQDPKEYRRSLKANPGIPFSAEKKPIQGVLKASPFPSLVNPFVKRSKRNKRLSF